MSNRNRVYGANIREARLALNEAGKPRAHGEVPMSQVKLAELVGVTQQTVSEWEKGAWAPREETRVVIAKVTGRDPHELFPLVLPQPAEAAS